VNPRLRTAGLLFVASIGFQLGFMFLDAFLSDEGVVLVVAEDLAGGKRLYRDVYTPVTPAVYLLQGWAFKLMGASFAVSRVLMCIVYATSVALTYWIATHQLPRHVAMWIGIAAIPLQVWMWPHAHYFSYNALAILCCLLAIERAWAIEATMNRRRAALGLGLAFAAGLWSKPNLALATGGGVLLYWLLGWLRTGLHMQLMRDRGFAEILREGLAVLAGIAAGSLPFVVFLGATGSLSPMFESLLALSRVYGDVPSDLFPSLFPLTGQLDALRTNPDLVFPGMLSNAIGEERVFRELLAYTGWLDLGVRVIYYTPIALFILVAAVLLRALQTRSWSQDHEAALLTLCTALGLFATIIPHPALHYMTPTLLPLIACSAFALRSVLQGLSGLRSTIAKATCWTGFAVYVGVSLAIVGAYANLPRDPVPTERGTFWVEPGTARAWNAIVDFARERIPEDDDVFAAPHFPMFYFLTGREHPTPWSDLRPGSPGTGAEAEIVETLESEPVPWVLRLVGSQFDRLERFDVAYPRLARYIDEHYEVAEPIDDRYGVYAEFLRRSDIAEGE
jgi:hypothetical protein